MPKISIITTIHNRDRYLAKAIASVSTQTYQDFELILFDDGSTDNSLAIALEYAAQDKRIKLIASPHIGRIPALIEASKQATGEYAGVLDSDDWISDNALAETVAVLDSKPEVGVVYTNCVHTDPEGNILGERKQNQLPFSRDRLLIDFIIFHLRIYRRSLFEQVGGYDSTLLKAEDYDLALKLSEITQAEFIPAATYYYRQHPQSMGASNRIEQIYWTKKVIERSLLRTGDQRKIQVYISEARFKLTIKE
jgi:glycosyltransferase involved in cell wall biosynthesis